MGTMNISSDIDNMPTEMAVAAGQIGASWTDTFLIVYIKWNNAPLRMKVGELATPGGIILLRHFMKLLSRILGGMMWTRVAQEWFEEIQGFLMGRGPNRERVHDTVPREMTTTQQWSGWKWQKQMSMWWSRWGNKHKHSGCSMSFRLASVRCKEVALAFYVHVF